MSTPAPTMTPEPGRRSLRPAPAAGPAAPSRPLPARPEAGRPEYAPGPNAATWRDTTVYNPFDSGGIYGPRGWTTLIPLWELLRCFPAHRERGQENTGGTENAGGTEGTGGTVMAGFDLDPCGGPAQDYVSFAGLDAEAALDLLEWLPANALEDRQNLGPSLRRLLRACATGGDRVLLSGYGIGPQRFDERLSVEALWVRDPDLLDYRVSLEHDQDCQCRLLWRTVQARSRLDAESPPDEIRLLSPAWCQGEVGWWLWWD